jgi:hypothetical protein
MDEFEFSSGTVSVPGQGFKSIFFFFFFFFLVNDMHPVGFEPMNSPSTLLQMEEVSFLKVNYGNVVMLLCVRSRTLILICLSSFRPFFKALFLLIYRVQGACLQQKWPLCIGLYG